MNILGSVVVAGNVRRSAQIAIGDHSDKEYMMAKRWDLGNIPNWRAMSNNSVVCNDYSELGEDFWEGYNGNGEPYGLINLKSSRLQGRTFETQYPDPDIQGYNPCAEQGLANFETCCLAEIYLPNITSQTELNEVATYLYRINKHSLAIPCSVKETEAIVHKNMRMGIGVTGYLQATEEQRSWLDGTYRWLRAYDIAYSDAMGWPQSIKLTTVKPSGTVSQLVDSASGIHPRYSNYYIRTVRADKKDPLAQLMRQQGFPVESCVMKPDNTDVFKFPVKGPTHAVFRNDRSALEQLEHYLMYQTFWSEHNVSITVYIKDHEWLGVGDWVYQNFDKIAGVSFLPHSDHSYQQAPYTECSEEEYLALLAKMPKFDWDLMAHFEKNDATVNMKELACMAGGSCEIL
jgi:ribonucleoside-diphosphate reductase alpha chain